MDKEHEGILSTAENAVEDTAKAGFEGAKNLAESAGSVVSDAGVVGFEGAKKLAVSAGETATDGVGQKGAEDSQGKALTKKETCVEGRARQNEGGCGKASACS